MPELCEHPGAEHNTESWQVEVDVGVRVFIKMGGQLGLELGNGFVQPGNDLDQRFRGGSGRHRDRWRRGELRGPQRLLDLNSTPVEVPLASAAFERIADLGDRQLSGLVGVRRFGERCDSVTVGEAVERNEGGGEELAEIVAEPVGVTGPVPGQVLVGTCEDFQPVGLVGVTGDSCLLYTSPSPRD